VGDKQNYFSRVKGTIMTFATYAAILWIIYSYLNILGTEKSQEVKYISSLSFNYNVSLIPKLLPMHQFMSFKTEDIRNRILCVVYNDPE
jgi:hypothetical protein